MFKKLQNGKNLISKGGKGFTLVELMIVIAVIALLILVLLPRVGIIKNKSREAGMRTNLVMLEGIIQSVIDEYPFDGVAAVEARIAADIDAVAVDNQKLKNPFTGTVTDTHNCLPAAVLAGDVVVYSTAAYADEAAVDAAWTATVGGADATVAEGVIAYAAFPNGNKLNVRLIPYGVGGARIDALRKTISQ